MSPINSINSMLGHFELKLSNRQQIVDKVKWVALAALAIAGIGLANAQRRSFDDAVDNSPNYGHCLYTVCDSFMDKGNLYRLCRRACSLRFCGRTSC